MGEPLCLICKETGTVPLECLFKCQRGAECEVARPASVDPAPAPGDVRCKHCGADVHWRETEDGWRLYDNERQHPGNRYIEHHCPTTPEGFDEEPV